MNGSKLYTKIFKSYKGVQTKIADINPELVKQTQQAVNELYAPTEAYMQAQQALLNLENTNIQSKVNPYSYPDLSYNGDIKKMSSLLFDVNKRANFVQHQTKRMDSADEFERNRSLQLARNAVKGIGLGLQAKQLVDKKEQETAALTEELFRQQLDTEMGLSSATLAPDGRSPHYRNYIPNVLIGSGAIDSHLGALKDVGSLLGETFLQTANNMTIGAGGASELFGQGLESITGPATISNVLQKYGKRAQEGGLKAKEFVKDYFNSGEGSRLEDLESAVTGTGYSSTPFFNTVKNAFTQTMNLAIPGVINDEMAGTALTLGLAPYSVPAALALGSKEAVGKSILLGKEQHPDLDTQAYVNRGDLKYKNLPESLAYEALNAVSLGAIALPTKAMISSLLAKGATQATSYAPKAGLLRDLSARAEGIARRHPISASASLESGVEAAQSYLETKNNPNLSPYQRKEAIKEGAIVGALTAGIFSAAPAIKNSFEKTEAQRIREASDTTRDMVGTFRQRGVQRMNYDVAIAQLMDGDTTNTDRVANTLLANAHREQSQAVIEQAVEDIKKGVETSENPFVQAVKEKILENPRLALRALGEEAFINHSSTSQDNRDMMSSIQQARTLDIIEEGNPLNNPTSLSRDVFTPLSQEQNNAANKKTQSLLEKFREERKTNPNLTALEFLQRPENRVQGKVSLKAVTDFIAQLDATEKADIEEKLRTQKELEKEKEKKAREANKVKVEPLDSATSNENIINRVTNENASVLNLPEEYNKHEDNTDTTIELSDSAIENVETETIVQNTINEAYKDEEAVDGDRSRLNNIASAERKSKKNIEEKKARFTKVVKALIARALKRKKDGDENAYKSDISQIAEALAEESAHSEADETGDMVLNTLISEISEAGILPDVVEQMVSTEEGATVNVTKAEAEEINKNVYGSEQTSQAVTKTAFNVNNIQKRVKEVDDFIKTSKQILIGLQKERRTRQMNFGFVEANQWKDVLKTLGKVLALIAKKPFLDEDTYTNTLNMYFDTINRIYQDIATKARAIEAAHKAARENTKNLFEGSKYKITDTTSEIVFFSYNKNDPTNVQALDAEEVKKLAGTIDGKNESVISKIMEKNTTDSDIKYVYITKTDLTKEASQLSLLQELNAFKKKVEEVVSSVKNEVEQKVKEQVRKQTAPEVNEGSRAVIQHRGKAKAFLERVNTLRSRINILKQRKKEILKSKKSLDPQDVTKIEKIKRLLVASIKEYDSLILAFKKDLLGFTKEDRQAIDKYLSLGYIYDKVQEGVKYFGEVFKRHEKSPRNKMLLSLLKTVRDSLVGTIREFNNIIKELWSHFGYDRDTAPTGLLPINFNETIDSTITLDEMEAQELAVKNLGSIEGKYKYSNPALAEEAREQRINVHSSKKGFLRLVEAAKKALEKAFSFSLFNALMSYNDTYSTSFNPMVSEIRRVQLEKTDSSDISDLFEPAKDGKAILKQVYAEALAIAYSIYYKEIKTTSTPLIDKGGINKESAASEGLEVKLARIFMDVLEVQFSKELTNKETRTQLLRLLGSQLNQIATSAGLSQNFSTNLETVGNAVDKSMFKNTVGYYTSKVEAISNIQDRVDNGLFKQAVSWLKKTAVFKMVSQGFNIAKTGVVNVIKNAFATDIDNLVELFVLKNPAEGSIYPKSRPNEKVKVVKVAYTDDFAYNMKYIRDFINLIDDETIRNQLWEFVNRVIEQWDLGVIDLDKTSPVKDADSLVLSHSARASNSLREFVEALSFSLVSDTKSKIYLQVDIQDLMRTSNSKFQANKDLRSVLHLGSEMTPDEANERNEDVRNKIERYIDENGNIQELSVEDIRVNNFMVALTSMDVYTPNRKSPQQVLNKKKELVAKDPDTGLSLTDEFYAIIDSKGSMISKAIQLWNLLEKMGERPYSIFSMINVLASFKMKGNKPIVDYTKLQIWIDASTQGSAIVNTLMGITRTQRELAQKSGLGLMLIEQGQQGTAAYERINEGSDNYYKMMKNWFNAVFSGVNQFGQVIMQTKLSTLFPDITRWNKEALATALRRILRQKYETNPLLANLFDIVITNIIPDDIEIDSGMTLEQIVTKSALAKSARNTIGKWLLMLISYGSTNINNSGKMILNAINNDLVPALLWEIQGQSPEGKDNILAKLFRNDAIVDGMFGKIESRDLLKTYLLANEQSLNGLKDLTDSQINQIYSFLFMMKHGLNISNAKDLHPYLTKKSFGSEEVATFSRNMGTITAPVVNDAISAATGYSEEILHVAQVANHIKNYYFLKKWVIKMLTNKNRPHTAEDVKKYIDAYKEGNSKGFFLTNLSEFTDQEREQAFKEIMKEIENDDILKKYFGLNFFNSLTATNILIQIKEDNENNSLNSDLSLKASSTSETGESIVKSPEAIYYVEFGTTFAPSIGQESDSFLIDRLVNELSAEGITFWHVFDSIGTNVAEADKVTEIANRALEDLVKNFEHNRLFTSLSMLEKAWGIMNSEIPEINTFAYSRDESTLDEGETTTEFPKQATSLAARIQLTVAIYKANAGLLSVNMFDSSLDAIASNGVDTTIAETQESKEVVTQKEVKAKRRLDEYNEAINKTEMLLSIGRLLGISTTLNILDNDIQLKQFIEKINNVLQKLRDLDIPFDKIFINQVVPNNITTENIQKTTNESNQTNFKNVVHNFTNGLNQQELQAVLDFFSTQEAIIADITDNVTSTNPLYTFTTRNVYKRAITKYLLGQGIPYKISNMIASHITRALLSNDQNMSNLLEAERENLKDKFSFATQETDNAVTSIPNIVRGTFDNSISEITSSDILNKKLKQLDEFLTNQGIKFGTGQQVEVLKKLILDAVAREESKAKEVHGAFKNEQHQLKELNSGDIVSIFSVLAKLSESISNSTELEEKAKEFLKLLGIVFNEGGSGRISTSGSLINTYLGNMYNNNIPSLADILSDLKETTLANIVVSKGIEEGVPTQLANSNTRTEEVKANSNYLDMERLEESMYNSEHKSEEGINFEEAQIDEIVLDRVNISEEEFEEITNKILELQDNTYTNSSTVWIKDRISGMIAPFAKGINVVVSKVRGIARSGSYNTESNQVSLFLSDVTTNNMSPVEIFAHESTHAVLEAAKRSKDPIIINALSEMQTIQKRFLAYAKAHTREISEQLGVSEEVFRQKYINYMETFEEFGSIINSNEKLWKVLNGIPYKISLGQRFFNLMKIISNAVFGTNFVLDGIPSGEQFDQLYLSMNRANQNLQNAYKGLATERAIRKTFDYLDKAVAPIMKVGFNAWAKGVRNLLDKKLAKKNKVNPIMAAIYFVASVPVLGREEIKERAIEIARRAGTDNNWFQSLVSHAAGVAREFSEIKGQSMQIDILRNNVISVYKEMLKEAIGRELTIPEQQSFTRVIKRTDLTSLSRIDEMIKAVRDRSGSYLDAQMNAEVRKIRSLIGGDASKLEYTLTASDNLAHYMVTGETKGFFLSNAVNIARSLTLSPNAVITEETTTDVQELVNAIDRYVTFKALRETKQSDLEALRSLSDENLTKTLEIVKEVNDKALNAFYEKGTEISNYEKGYVKSQASKSVTVRIGTRDNTTYMKELGYKRVDNFSALNNVLLNDLALFYSTTEYTQSFNMGAVRAISGKTRGYTIGAYIKAKFPDADYNEMQALSIAKIRNIGTLLSNHKDPSWKGSNILPVFDNKGRLQDFRITIPHKVKEQLGIQETSIFDALGGEMGNLVDKELSRDHNRKAVKDLEAYYQAHKGNELIHFVTIGPNPHSSNSNIPLQKLEDYWNSLPEDMKTLIIKEHKGQLHIRSDLLATILGYKDFRLISDDLDPARVLPNNKIRRILRFLEASVSKSGAWNKTRVVLKNPKTVINNIKSNLFVMSTFGYNLSNILPDLMLSIRNLEAYNIDMKKKAHLIAKRESAKDKLAIDRQIAFIDSKWKNSSVKKLDDRGLYSDIVDDTSFESEVNNPDMFDKYIDKGFSYITNPLQRNAMKELVMTSDSQGFALMKKIFTYSDMVFKDIAYQHLTEKKGYSQNQALDAIERAFVNYSNLEHPLLKYFGDINLIMFPKYFLNITRFVNEDMLQDHLGRTVVAGLLDAATDVITTPFTSFLPLRLADADYYLNTPLLSPLKSITGIGSKKSSDIFALDNFLPIDVNL